MTPVDIDKLKELLAKAKLPWSAPEKFWVYEDGKGAQHRVAPVVRAGLDDFDAGDKTALIVAAVNSLAALIAKAERVDALEAALREIAAHPPILNLPSTMQVIARNALSPKPEDATP